jgi:exodeoxyribonuclease VII large subunit
MTVPLWSEQQLWSESPATETRAAAEPRTVTLVRLAGEIARAVGAIGMLAVEGEVHRPSTGRSGWTWFVLRDRAAQIEVKVPRANASRCRVVAGERVRVTGRLEWTPDRGQVHLVAEEVSPVGAGAIAALIAEVRARLGADGILDRPRRPIPLLPAVIGVVCGSEAAVKKDIQSVVVDRFPGYPLRFAETTVSGPGAPSAIVAALDVLTGHPDVEVVILARGGGDATSLLPWSSEEVCRAVAAAAVPVVSAIGHDGDRPLCDEVADLRCGTPSIAAAAVVPDRVVLVGRLDRCRDRVVGAVAARSEHARRQLGAVDTGSSLRRGMEVASGRLDSVQVRLGDLHPRRRLRACADRLDAVDVRRPIWQQLGRAAGRLDADGRHLRALGPHRVLQRGYAVVTGPDGAVLRRAADIAAGEQVGIQLAEGALLATVEGTLAAAPHTGPAAPLSGRAVEGTTAVAQTGPALERPGTAAPGRTVAPAKRPTGSQR